MMEIFKLEKDKLSLCQNGLFIKYYISIQLLQKGPFFWKLKTFTWILPIGQRGCHATFRKPCRNNLVWQLICDSACITNMPLGQNLLIKPENA